MKQEITIHNEMETDDGWEFTVETPDGTKHVVQLTEDYHKVRAAEGTTPPELVRKSFNFLLEREPASMIMAEFDLSVIETYFPEYKDKQL